MEQHEKLIKEVVEVYKDVLNDDQVLVAIVDGSIGVATKNENGYNKTSYRPSQRYNVTSQIVEECNRRIYPNLTDLEIASITLSSFKN